MAAWAAALLAALLMPAPAAAETLKLDFPLKCSPGSTCWIPSYVDHDPTKGIRDYTCGKATYNGTSGKVSRHKGTDIAIRDMAAMRAGVEVLAAAAGRVAGVRDGMADINIRDASGLRALKGQGLRKRGPDPPSRRLGHPVLPHAEGQRRRQEGQHGHGRPPPRTGRAVWRHFIPPPAPDRAQGRKKIVDPFVGLSRKEQCGPGEEPLWKADVLAKLPYRPTALYSAGFTTGKPNHEKARDGAYREKTFSRLVPALVLWVDVFRVRKGDRLSITITGPGSSKVFQHTADIEKDQARRFAFAGKPRKSPLWDAGVYRGEVKLVRAGGETYSIVREITIR